MNRIFVIIAFVALAGLSSYGSGGPEQPDQENHSHPESASGKKDGEALSFSEYRAIAAALKPYIDAAKTGDGDHLRTAFYDHAHIVGSTHGEFHNVDADGFSKAINGSKSPNVEHHIAWIDVSGPAAAARVEFIHWNGFRFTDFFVLYKQDGHWKISGKVYDSHTKN